MESHNQSEEKEIIEPSVKSTVVQPYDPYTSEEINELALALSKAQGEFLPVAQSRQNPFFKSQYADLDAYISAVRPALAKHGLAFYQFTKISPDGSPTVLHTRLIHASGQWIESRSRIIPIKNDMQAYGSALSYQRRYSAMTLLGITSNNDPLDDDGEATVQRQTQQSFGQQVKR